MHFRYWALNQVQGDSSILPQHRPYDALDQRIVRVDGGHGGVGGLEADAGGFAVEALQGRVGVVEEGDHDVAVTRRRVPFPHHEVAVQDAVVDHRGALHLEDVGVDLIDDHVGRDVDGVVR